MGTRADLAERDRRYEKVREAMARAGLDALVVAGHGAAAGYIQYLTNFRTGGHQCLLLLPMVGEPVMALSSYAVAVRAARQGWVEVRGALNIYDATLIQRMVEAAGERGLTKGRVGVAGMEWVMPHGTFEKLRKALPGATIVNADELMDRVRMVKTPLEVKQVRELHATVRSVVERVLELLRPGVNSIDLDREAAETAAAGGASASVQIREGLADRPLRGAPLKCDDITSVYLGVRGGGGHGSEQLLTCLFRRPTRLEEMLAASERRAYDEVCRLARPGARLVDLAKAYGRVMAEDGWMWEGARAAYDFHGIGMDGVERPCYAEIAEEPSQNWPLEEGVVLNYHPRRNLKPPKGVEISARDRELLTTYNFPSEIILGVNEDIMVTGNGAERLLGDLELCWRMMAR